MVKVLLNCLLLTHEKATCIKTSVRSLYQYTRVYLSLLYKKVLFSFPHILIIINIKYEMFHDDYNSNNRCIFIITIILILVFKISSITQKREFFWRIDIDQ